MKRVPAPVLVAGGLALVVALLYRWRPRPDGRRLRAGVVKVCGCLLA